MKKIALLLVLISSAQSGFSQIGDLLKREGLKFAKKEGVNLLTKELNKTKAKFDSTSFSYAVALSDKAAQFESKDKLADVVTVSSMFVNKDKHKSNLQLAQEYMDVGEMAYSANGFKLAEGSFMAANTLLLAEGAESNPLYGRGLANLGLLYNNMGRYSAATELTTEALRLREQIFGKESRDYAASLNNLAVLHKDLGNYNEAEKEITEAIDVNLRTSGEESIAYAISLNNRGVLYQTLGRYEIAELDMTKAIQVAAHTLKPSSLQYTRLQSNLALLYQQQGQFEKAEKIYTESVSAIARNPSKSKKSNPDYAHMIENLASLYELMGRHDEAEKLYLEAMAVYEKKFGDDYSGYGLAAARLGALYLAKKELPAAENYLIKAEGVMRNSFGDQHPNTVDLIAQLGVLYWQKGDIDKAEGYLSQALDASLEFVGLYFAPMSDTEKALYWKTLQPRFERYYAFAAAIDNNEVSKRALQYRIATKAMLLSGTTKFKNKILASGDKALINDYETWLDQKGTLAHYYAMSMEELTEQQINLDSIDRAANQLEKSLSERSGLFTTAYKSETPQLNRVQEKLQPGEKAVELIRIGASHHNELEYLAYIISTSSINKVVIKNGIDLEGKQYKLYRNLIKYKRDDSQSYANYWQAIDEVLGDAQKVYISLDGVYNQISISALQSAEGVYLIDKRTYTIISSLRDLVNDKSNKQVNSKSATLIGNPTYGSDKVAALPGTGDEVKAIRNLLSSSGYSTSLKVANDASEDELENTSINGILHIATHGFFVPDPKDDQTSVFSIPLYNVQENVLLRSGLLLAGAGEIAGSTTDGSNNGVLTSYEVMGLNLDETDIVVLSACETGLGDVMSGEGVFGLQRAFLIAGSSTVIMSLWKVDDEATRQLMVNFYTNWISSGDMETSFVDAQQEVRKSFNHPYYWGSFILLKN